MICREGSRALNPVRGKMTMGRDMAGEVDGGCRRVMSRVRMSRAPESEL